MRLLIVLNFFVLATVLSTCNAKPLQDGVIYQDYRHSSATIIRTLTVNPTKVRIVAARAQDAGHGLATVSTIAKHFSAIAAINGGFFRFNQTNGAVGVSAGALKINGAWHGIAYSSRGAIGWDPSKNIVLFDLLQTESKMLINQQPMPINAMNKLSNGNKGILLSDSYVDSVNVDQSTAVLFAKEKVTQLYTTGLVTIPQSSHMYRVSGTLQPRLSGLKIGDPVSLEIKAIPQIDPATTQLWNSVPFILGGGPMLIYDKKLINNFTSEKLSAEFINQRYARTAVGILPNKSWVFVVADRNIIQEDSGLTLAELASFMQSLGCTYALNLDGGGSSSMYVQNIEQLDFARPVADALLVLSRD